MRPSSRGRLVEQATSATATVCRHGRRATAEMRPLHCPHTIERARPARTAGEVLQQRRHADRAGGGRAGGGLHRQRPPVQPRAHDDAGTPARPAVRARPPPPHGRGGHPLHALRPQRARRRRLVRLHRPPGPPHPAGHGRRDGTRLPGRGRHEPVPLRPADRRRRRTARGRHAHRGGPRGGAHRPRPRGHLPAGPRGHRGRHLYRGHGRTPAAPRHPPGRRHRPDAPAGRPADRHGTRRLRDDNVRIGTGLGAPALHRRPRGTAGRGHRRLRTPPHHHGPVARRLTGPPARHALDPADQRHGEDDIALLAARLRPDAVPRTPTDN